ncbi:MAG: hypothetical protein DWQ08_02700 [Proteobacteria bacterium]|nr:MAG: hypothetical protein DWQ08_02700 [Pseudomonadota bacterium]
MNPLPVLPQPAFLYWSPPPRCDLHAMDLNALAAVNRALVAFDSSPLSTLAELFPESALYLSTYPQLDHYGARDESLYWGTPDQRGMGETPIWPRESGEKIFVYMHPHYPQFEPMLRQLGALRDSVLVVAPGIGGALANQYRRPHLRIQSNHVDLDQVAERCRVVICHGGHGTVVRMLRRGIAPIVLPQFVEQTMLAHRMAEQALVLAASPDPRRHDFATMIRTAIESDLHRQSATRFASRYPPSGGDDRVASMARRMLSLGEKGAATTKARVEVYSSTIPLARSLYGDEPEASEELNDRARYGTPFLGAVDDELERVREALESSASPHRSELERARYLTVTGLPRSGRSLVGAMLDAHPEIVISQDLDVLELLARDFTPSQVRRIIAEESFLAARMQRQRKAYAHAVPGESQGRWRQLVVLGGGAVAMTATSHVVGGLRLRRLIEAFGPDQKLLVVVRNPFDSIAGIVGNAPDGKLSSAADEYFALCESFVSLSCGLREGRSLFVHYESLVDEPGGELGAICKFLDVEVAPRYLDSCSRIIFDEPDILRGGVEWYPELVESIAERMNDYPFLGRYQRSL